MSAIRNNSCFLLDCDEALPGIVAHLDGKGLASLASTCKTLRDLLDGDDGKRWWRRLCQNLLGKTVSAVHLAAAGGEPASGTARFWRQLYRHALHADTFHWHAESSRRAWASVHAQDEAYRSRAFAAAAAAGVAGPYVGRVDGTEFHHDNVRMAINGGYAPHGHPDVEACRREIRRRAELAVAPQLGPDLMRSGHTSTLLDDLGLLVVVGGLMKASMRRRELAMWMHDGGGGREDLMGGREGDIKVLVVKLPEMEVITPEVINWRTRSRPVGGRTGGSSGGGGGGRSGAGGIDVGEGGGGGRGSADAGADADADADDGMAAEHAPLLPTPPSRFRHSAVEARLPPGSRLSLEAFGDGGEGWGSSCGTSGSGSGSDCREGSTVLVYGGYDGSTSVWGGRELLLLRVSADGRRVRWGACDALGDAPPPCFHHTMTRLRRDHPVPRAVLIGGQTDDEGSAFKLGGGAAYELDVFAGSWARRATDGWPQPAAGAMTVRWLHAAALRPEQAPDEVHDDDKCVDVFTTQDRVTGEKLVHRGPSAPPWYSRERRGEEIVVLGGFDDSPHRMVADMEPWVLCVDTWRWKFAPAPGPSSNHPLARARCKPPVGRHRTAACVLGGRLMVVHGGCPALGSSWLSDTAVLDLTTLTWRHVNVHVAGTENVRHKRIAGHSLDAMMCFGGCKRGKFGITPISRLEFLMFGPPHSGLEAEKQERTFREESTDVKRRMSRYAPLCVDQVRGGLMRILHHETKGVCAVPLEAQYFPGDAGDEDTDTDTDDDTVDGDDTDTVDGDDTDTSDEEDDDEDDDDDDDDDDDGDEDDDDDDDDDDVGDSDDLNDDEDADDVKDSVDDFEHDVHSESDADEVASDTTGGASPSNRDDDSRQECDSISRRR